MAGIGVDFVPAHDHWYSLSFNSTPDGKITESSSTYSVTGQPHRHQHIP